MGKYMAIDMEVVRTQQRELNMVSEEVSSVKRRLNCYQKVLDDAWKSNGIKGIDSAIEEILYRLNRMAKDLEDLGHDILMTGEEVRIQEVATEGML